MKGTILVKKKTVYYIIKWAIKKRDYMMGTVYEADST